jgi:iron complex outermembrane recepter protein
MVLMTSRLALSQFDLGEATLEQLLNTKITSVSKKEQTLSQTAAAVYVINQDDIRRSGAANIPDLLRLVPGVEVAQINANRWAISIRGFNSAYSDKVLVLVDGRSVYSGIFSGVIWDQVGMPLEQIERIEVILGPGGSVWGANAVDGVISIVTKSSADTKGGMVSAGGGSSTLANEAVRYGGTVGAKGSYEVFGQYSRTSDFLTPSGLDAGDGWDRKQGGFRSDWNLSPGSSLTVEGDYFLNHGNQAVTSGLFPSGPAPLFDLGFFARGGNVEGQWKHTSSSGSEESVQLYYSSSNRMEQGVHMLENRLDLEYQDRFHFGRRDDFVVGVGYRRDSGFLSATDWISFVPPSKTDNLVSGFVQDEISLSSTVRLTIGSKLEHNSYTGFEYEPTIRLAWSATSKSTIWLAANRAITQPSQWETSLQAIAGEMPVGNFMALVTLYGNPKLETESLLDYELGYRRKLARKVSVDLASFAGSYRGLIGVAPALSGPTLGPGGQIVEPVVIANAQSALDYGGEISFNWDVLERWQLTAGYALLEQIFGPYSGLNLGDNAEDPKHAFQTHSRLNLPGKLELDPWIWWTAALGGSNIPEHTRVNVRVGRRLGESAEISVTGQNLASPRFLEFGNSYGFAGTAVPRSIFAKVTWYF